MLEYEISTAMPVPRQACLLQELEQIIFRDGIV